MLQHQDHRTSDQELNDIERGNNCVETGYGWWMEWTLMAHWTATILSVI